MHSLSMRVGLVPHSPLAARAAQSDWASVMASQRSALEHMTVLVQLSQMRWM